MKKTLLALFQDSGILMEFWAEGEEKDVMVRVKVRVWMNAWWS